MLDDSGTAGDVDFARIAFNKDASGTNKCWTSFHDFAVLGSLCLSEFLYFLSAKTTEVLT